MAAALYDSARSAFYRFIASPSVSPMGIRDYIDNNFSLTQYEKNQIITPYTISLLNVEELYELFNETAVDDSNTPIFMNSLTHLKVIPEGHVLPTADSRMTAMKQIIYYEMGVSPLYVQRGLSMRNMNAYNAELRTFATDEQNTQYLNPTEFDIPADSPVPRRLPAKVLIGVVEVYTLFTIELYIDMRKKDLLKFIHITEDDVSPYTQWLVAIFNSLRTSLVPKSDREYVARHIAPAVFYNLSCLNGHLINILDRVPYDLLFNNTVSHIGFRLNQGSKKGLIHHAIHFENSALVEVAFVKYPGMEMIQAGVGIHTMFVFLRNASRILSPVIIYEYENPYPSESLKTRSLWALGRFNFKTLRTNCEVLANWVFQNNGGGCSMEIPVIDSTPQYRTEGFLAFWSLLLEPEKKEEWFAKFTRTGGSKRMRKTKRTKRSRK